MVSSTDLLENIVNAMLTKIPSLEQQKTTLRTELAAALESMVFATTPSSSDAKSSDHKEGNATTTTSSSSSGSNTTGTNQGEQPPTRPQSNMLQSIEYSEWQRASVRFQFNQQFGTMQLASLVSGEAEAKEALRRAAKDFVEAIVEMVLKANSYVTEESTEDFAGSVQVCI